MLNRYAYFTWHKLIILSKTKNDWQLMQYICFSLQLETVLCFWNRVKYSCDGFMYKPCEDISWQETWRQEKEASQRIELMKVKEYSLRGNSPPFSNLWNGFHADSAGFRKQDSVEKLVQRIQCRHFIVSCILRCRFYHSGVYWSVILSKSRFSPCKLSGQTGNKCSMRWSAHCSYWRK